MELRIIVKKLLPVISIFLCLFASVKFSFAQHRILLVHSYHEGYTWTDGITAGVKKALSDTDCQLKIFYMDTKRKTEQEWKIKAGQMALSMVSSYNPHVIIAADDNAQEYFAKKLAGKQDVSIIFCGVNADPSLYDYPTSNVTGILERPFFQETLTLINSINKNIKRAVIIGDGNETTTAAYR